MLDSVTLTSHNLLEIIPRQPAAPPASLCLPEETALAIEAACNREAYAELYRRYATSVYRYMLAYTGNTHDAQDLTAQTFLAGLEGIAGFRARGTFAAWLFSIARRKAIDHYRRHPRTIPIDSLEDTPHPDQQPDQAFEDRFNYEQLAGLIRTLAPDRAEAITLRVFAELSIGEIAELMGRSESAVRMLLSRAVHDLKHKLSMAEQSAHR
ncbi:MAG: RNA polymerase sigma factor [Chloroflexi bacterium]|nr:RNA polymerase sigma factor [Chloroflexota bacterium]